MMTMTFMLGFVAHSCCRGAGVKAGVLAAPSTQAMLLPVQASGAGLVVLAEQSKIPEHFLVSLREKAGPECEIVDLQHEVHYDDNNGGGINNLSVILEACWKIFGPDGWRTDGSVGAWPWPIEI